ncbi:MAG: T9SS type A sorting domain-containing protein [Bacteroidia bacterium]|nr:T9SS type A sorting domain-containing protein [Bacteroidia bacterium]MDW8302647.1 T9SS type A sorting domain-containing protein [Bacteroidia bacterium]
MRFSSFAYIGIAFFILLAALWLNLKYRVCLTTKNGKTLALVLGEKEHELPLSKDRPDLAILQDFEMTKDPALGYVPTERLYQAYLYAEQLRKNPVAKTAGIPMNWTERGPKNVAGRTRTIMIDPNDPTKKTVFTAGVNGGIWKTTDITATNPIWTPINDFMTNLAVTTLAYDPTNPNVMYAGTGEGYFNSDAARGAGIFKSTNGGNTWTQLSSTNNPFFYYVNKVFVSSAGTLFAATNQGLRRSTDGGNTWTTVSTIRCFDIEQASNGHLYAGHNGVIRKSTDDGVTWTNLTTPTTFSRVELACAASDANYVYALCEEDNAVKAILKTTNGGTSWTSLPEPNDADPGIPDTDFSRGQAWYDLSIAVSNTNRDLLFVGGIDLFRSTNGGNSWQQVSHWYGGFGYQEVHADQHFAIFEPGSGTTVYFATDGGIYRCTNATASMPTIVQRNNTYNVTQFYACAIHPNAGSNHFLAGSQDNGSQRFSSPGMNSTVEVTGGDGGYCHIDQNQPQYQWTSYVNNNYFRSTNGGNTFSSVTLSNNTGASFINPTDYDDVANIMYCSNSNGNFVRWTNPQSGSTHTVVTVSAFGGGDVTHINANTNTPNRVFFGLNNGRVVRVDNAHTGTSLTGVNIKGASMPTTSVSCIAVQKGDDNHLLVTYSSYGVNSVWETKDGGVTWTSVEGNLPDIPVRWAIFNPHNPDQAVLATELGVWTTSDLNGTATVWVPTNSGLANTRVTMLQIRDSDKMVIASTHGRGLFSSDAFVGGSSVSAEFEVNKKVTYVGKNIQFTDASTGATSWAWDFENDGVVDATTQNPTFAYTTPGLKTVKLVINGGCSTCTKIKTALIHVLPDRNTSYTLADGGDFETNPLDFAPAVENSTSVPWERGNSTIAGKDGTTSGSNAWVTGLTSNTYTNNSVSYLYTPNFDFSAAGNYTIQFQTKYKVETNWDGFNVEYSLDKGDTWQVLGTLGTDWYNYSVNLATAFDANVPFFTGVQSTYTLKKLDISFLAGNPSVAFRIVFKSDVGIESVGVAIDDFQILRESTSINENEIQANITLFPNPVREKLYFEYAGKIYSNLKVCIYNLQGKVISQEIVPMYATHFVHSVSVQHLSKGIYFLNLEADGQRKTLKFVKE